jgi:hypothetical protein
MPCENWSKITQTIQKSLVLTFKIVSKSFEFEIFKKNENF